MAVRWVCPSCGSGVNAPQRPRKNDVRRYCLVCSASTGFLVERTAPALDRRRDRADALRRDRDAKKREAERRRWIISCADALGRRRDIDVRAELRQALTACGYFEGWAPGHRPKMDDLSILIRRSKKPYSTGRASSFNVAFTFGEPASYEECMELIYHEAAHMAAPEGEHHGPKYRRILAVALQKRWPWLRYGSVRRGRCYEADEAIVKQMREYVRGGGEL